jgi:uncharacterized Tic20 family protein
MSDTTPRPDDPRDDTTPDSPVDDHGSASPAAPEPAAPEAAGAQESAPPPPPPDPTYAAPEAQQYPPQYPEPSAPQQYPPAAAPAGAGYPQTPAAPMSQQDERTWGMAAHGVALAATVVSAGVLSFVAALVMYLMFRDRGPFVRANTANALNIQIIVGIVFLISIPLMFVIIGIFTFAAAWVFAVVVHVIGMVKANNGEWWDPPLTPKFVS